LIGKKMIQENTNFMQNIFGAQWPSTANDVTGEELANRIINFLDPKTLCQLAAVNKSWAKLLKIQISRLSLPGQTAILSNRAAIVHSDIENTQVQENTAFIYIPGTLNQIFSSTIPPAVVFTPQEKSEIIQSKAYLDENIKGYESTKELYHSMIAPLLIKRRVTVRLEATRQKPSGERERFMITVEDIKNRYLSQRAQLLKHIRFLAEKANKLLDNRQCERAEAEFKIVLDYSVRVNGPNNIETLKIQAGYASAQVADLQSGSFEKGNELLKNTVEALEKELKVGSSEDTKRTLAIAYYHLAQFFNIKKQNDIALQYLNRSENLRKQYRAPEHEMDRIRYLRGKFLLQEGKTAEALAILQQCYLFRKSQNGLSPTLIPVLEHLHDIMEVLRDRYESVQYLRHLLMIKKHIKADEREIISIQIKMMIALLHKTRTQEFWDLMKEIENRLDQIPVNKQGLDIGRNYLDLANIRISTLLPQEWSSVKRRKYYAETLKIILRAEGHIASVRDKDFNGAYDGQVKGLKDRCIRAIELSQNPALRTIFIGQALHPEDEAELVLQSASLNDTNSVAYTPELLEALSDFSSEARHSLVDEAEQLLTVEGFSLLAEKGLIHPWRLRTAQAGITSTFTDTSSLEKMREQLIADPAYANKIPPIQIGIHKGKVYSFDTRRLIVHQQARETNPEVQIRYQKISGTELEQRVKAIYSEKPWNGIVTALRRGGKNSESEPYINPLFRAQLEEKVKAFRRYPSGREAAGADKNGFPIIKKRAEKIHIFLLARKESGSNYAKSILEECDQIANTQGRQAAYKFLIQQKEEEKKRLATKTAINDMREK
jgi:hypothetical protein